MKHYLQRKKLRLADYNYVQNGYYFVTICTKNREHFFGEVRNGEIPVNDFGKIAEKVLIELPDHYQNCQIDEYVFMPNHFHGIFIIQNPVGKGLLPFRESYESYESCEGNKKHGLSEIIRGFKTFSSKNINASQDELYFSWQKSFHDVIIRNQEQLDKTREYIRMNPCKWEEDINNIGYKLSGKK